MLDPARPFPADVSSTSHANQGPALSALPWPMAYRPWALAELTRRIFDTGHLVVIRRKLPSDRVTVDCVKTFLLFLNGGSMLRCPFQSLAIDRYWSPSKKKQQHKKVSSLHARTKSVFLLSPSVILLWSAVMPWSWIKERPGCVWNECHMSHILTLTGKRCRQEKKRGHIV